MTRKLLLTFALTGLVIMVGCSGKQQLTGTVTFSDDGSPVPTGVVFFETPTFSAQGSIKDGKYIVGSTAMADGIPKGTYQVSIRGAEDSVLIDGPGGSQIERRTLLIDGKYQRPDTSGLTFTVDGTRNTRTFNIQVDRAR